METKSSRAKMSLGEFQALPEGPPYYEFEDGEVIFMTSPHGQHQDVMVCLSFFLRTYVGEHRLGRVWAEIDVELTESKTYIPDIVYLSTEHIDRYHESDGKIHGLPNLVVEILSPSSISRDRVEKFNRYFDAGVPWYWIVDPDTLIVEEYHDEGKGYLRTEDAAADEIFRPSAFPGLELNLKELL